MPARCARPACSSSASGSTWTSTKSSSAPHARTAPRSASQRPRRQRRLRLRRLHLARPPRHVPRALRARARNVPRRIGSISMARRYRRGLRRHGRGVGCPRPPRRPRRPRGARDGSPLGRRCHPASQQRRLTTTQTRMVSPLTLVRNSTLTMNDMGCVYCCESVLLGVCCSAGLDDTAQFNCYRATLCDSSDRVLISCRLAIVLGSSSL